MWTPPARFIPAGTVRSATIVNRPAYIGRALRRRRGISKAKKAGIKFEKDVHALYHEEYGDCYVPSQWFQFHSEGENRPRTVQPDALHFDLEQGVITIVEIKLAHTVNAWWQLRQLYEPIVSFYYGPAWRYRVAEVFRWNKVSQPIPERAMHAPGLLFDTDLYKMVKVYN